MNKAALLMIVAAVFGLTAVGMGAMGTHAFGLVAGTREATLFQHAFIYQLVHAILLVWMVTQWHQSKWIRMAAWSLVVGIMMFCGGLYLLVFVGKTAISWVTPIGGSLIILAWLYLVIHGFLKIRNDDNQFHS